jgi:hypothetical protein
MLVIFQYLLHNDNFNNYLINAAAKIDNQIYFSAAGL